MIPTLEWTREGVRFLDQTRLPLEETYVLATSYQQVADVITTMVVRGAPAIGVSAAMGVALGVALGVIGFVRGTMTPEDILGNMEKRQETFTIKVPIARADEILPKVEQEKHFLFFSTGNEIHRLSVFQRGGRASLRGRGARYDDPRNGAAVDRAAGQSVRGT